MLWKTTNHPHVLMFIGVSEDLFAGTFSMVIPWMFHGDLRQFRTFLLGRNALLCYDLPTAFNELVSQTVRISSYHTGLTLPSYSFVKSPTG